jgi:hypothetical protein
MLTIVPQYLKKWRRTSSRKRTLREEGWFAEGKSLKNNKKPPHNKHITVQRNIEPSFDQQRFTKSIMTNSGRFLKQIPLFFYAEVPVPLHTPVGRTF